MARLSKLEVHMPDLVTGDCNNVSVSKIPGPTLEFSCTACANEVAIDSLSVREWEASKDQIAHEVPDFLLPDPKFSILELLRRLQFLMYQTLLDLYLAHSKEPRQSLHLDSIDGKVYSWSMFKFLGAKSDMLKNAPMFKRLDSKIKAGEIYYINWKTGKKVKEDPRKETETLKTDRFRGGR